MKVIIAGSRTFTDGAALAMAISAANFSITQIVSGGAKGVDRLGENYANDNGLQIKRFAPDWKRFGRAAGPIRNRHMAEYADALIAMWDGQSRGTKSMISEARKNGLKVHVHEL